MLSSIYVQGLGIKNIYQENNFIHSKVDCTYNPLMWLSFLIIYSFWNKEGVMRYDTDVMYLENQLDLKTD